MRGGRAIDPPAGVLRVHGQASDMAVLSSSVGAGPSSAARCLTLRAAHPLYQVARRSARKAHDRLPSATRSDISPD
jgi:hypothetical protein